MELSSTTNFACWRRLAISHVLSTDKIGYISNVTPTTIAAVGRQIVTHPHLTRIELVQVDSHTFSRVMAMIPRHHSSLNIVEIASVCDDLNGDVICEIVAKHMDLKKSSLRFVRLPSSVQIGSIGMKWVARLAMYRKNVFMVNQDHLADTVRFVVVVGDDDDDEIKINSHISQRVAEATMIGLVANNYS